MKKRIVITAVGMCLCGNAESQRVVCDGNGNNCKIEPTGQPARNKTEASRPESSPYQDAGYTVVSPVGRAAIKPIEQAPRLDTLAGKTIAVVGHNFMARMTHPEIKRLIPATPNFAVHWSSPNPSTRVSQATRRF